MTSDRARIAIAGDHHGVRLIERIVDVLVERGHHVTDLTARGEDTVDYPPLCAAVGQLVARDDVDMGIIVGGSGQGEVIACNKVRGVRAGVAFSEFSVEISRGNNDANVMAIGTKIIDDETALALLDRWLATPFKGGVHAERIAQIERIERDFGEE